MSSIYMAQSYTALLAYLLKYPRSGYTEYDFVGTVRRKHIVYIYKYNHKIQTHMLYYMCKILKAGGLERSHRLPQDCTKVMHRKFGDIV